MPWILVESIESNSGLWHGFSPFIPTKRKETHLMVWVHNIGIQYSDISSNNTQNVIFFLICLKSLIWKSCNFISKLIYSNNSRSKLKFHYTGFFFFFFLLTFLTFFSLFIMINKFLMNWNINQLKAE